jgi:two-component system, LytTR family, response regulator
MPAIRTVVIEDQPFARDHLVALLQQEGDVDVIGACATGAEAIDFVRTLKPDLVFLDLEMPDVDGFSVIDAVGRDQMPATIIVTAHDDRAVRAFDLPAFDYLLKPFGRERLQEALARARAHLMAARERDLTDRLLALAHDAAPITAEHGPERFVVKSAGRVLFVGVADIDWIESHGNYVRLHTGGRTHVVRETMASLEQRLDTSRFARIHRTRIVNLDRVRELRARGNGEYDVVLSEGTHFRVGRAFRQALHERLQKR